MPTKIGSNSRWWEEDSLSVMRTFKYLTGIFALRVGAQRRTAEIVFPLLSTLFP